MPTCVCIIVAKKLKWMMTYMVIEVIYLKYHKILAYKVYVTMWTKYDILWPIYWENLVIQHKLQRMKWSSLIRR